MLENIKTYFKSHKNISNYDILDYFKNKNRSCQVFCMYDDYVSVSTEDSKEFIKKTDYILSDRSQLYEYGYLSCNNIGLRTLLDVNSRRYCFGLVGVIMPDNKRHLVNFYIDENLDCWYIEPFYNITHQNPDYLPYLVIL